MASISYSLGTTYDSATAVTETYSAYTGTANIYAFQTDYISGSIVHNFFNLTTGEQNESYPSVVGKYSYNIDFSDNIGSVYLYMTNVGNNILRTGSGQDVVYAGEGNDLVYGNDGDDILYGRSGADTINGGGGNDILEGGEGADSIVGGIGIDTVSYEQSTRAVYVDLSSTTAQDNVFGGDAVGDRISGVENIRGGSGNDWLIGNGGRNVIEGGAGSDVLDGGAGIDVLSYAHADAGVYVVLAYGAGYGGEAAGDSFMRFENIRGSDFADYMYGDTSDNTMESHGGADTIFGFEGDDRIIVTETPDYVDGGIGKDLLLLRGGGEFDFTNANCNFFEAVVVENGVSADFSDVTTGTSFTSRSTTRSVTIIGTEDADRIKAGAAGDDITGGGGNDVMAGGAGEDKFLFRASGFGRDVLGRFDVNEDHLSIAGVDSIDDLTIRSVHGGRSTMITVDGSASGDAIILLGVSAADLAAHQDAIFDL